MKKIVSVAIALLMVFALTVSVAALDSPSGKDFYNISVSSVPSDGSLGTAETDKNKVNKEASGDDGVVTLTADPSEGFFTRWIISGDYEIVEGDLTSAVIKIRPKSDINATASYRVDKDNYTAHVSTRGDGTASADPTKVVIGSDGTMTFTATDGKDTFTVWELTGEYEIVEGSLKDRKLVIKPSTDIYAVAVFEGSGSSSTASSSSASSGSSNGSGTSPKTGDPIFIIIGLAVLALGAGTLAVKKIKE